MMGFGGGELRSHRGDIFTLNLTSDIIPRKRAVVSQRAYA